MLEGAWLTASGLSLCRIGQGLIVVVWYLSGGSSGGCGDGGGGVVVSGEEVRRLDGVLVEKRIP